jgi:L-idonate 5-dehydrogenase
MLRVVPDGVKLRIAALAEPASVAWHAVARAGSVEGRSALVIGCGPIGALLIAVLRRAGASTITAVDVLESPLASARSVGADRTLLAADTEAIAATDADIVFESSGNPRGLASAITGATRGGTVVMVGLPPAGNQPVPISLAISREIDLLGSFRFIDDMDDVLAALADGSLRVDPVVTHVFDATDAVQAFGVASDAATSCKVLLSFGPTDAGV